MRAQLFIVRTFVHDCRVVVSNVGDIGGLVNDGHVALRRNERGLDPLRAEFSGRNEAILVRTDVVVTIGPIVDAGVLIESGLWRQRRPADIIVALAPGYPGWGPLIARNPNPTNAAQTRPASVVIGCPTEWLFGNPGPARVGVNPATVGVRTPAP